MEASTRTEYVRRRASFVAFLIVAAFFMTWVPNQITTVLNTLLIVEESLQTLNYTQFNANAVININFRFDFKYFVSVFGHARAIQQADFFRTRTLCTGADLKIVLTNFRKTLQELFLVLISEIQMIKDIRKKFRNKPFLNY